MDAKMLCWPLHGVGLDNLGCDRKPCEWDVPDPQADELLVRIDSIGLCFSDVKLIRAGTDHPRVISKDLAEDPVVPGHEAVMTVVKVGDDLKDTFEEGNRYIIQADIYVNGVNYAYGYAINGGMAEYSILDQRVLDGDEGCYLLPLEDETPAAIAALIEPWTCVIASYMIDLRAAPESGGSMLVAMTPGNTDVYTWNQPVEGGAPRTIHCLNVNDATVANLRERFPQARIEFLSAMPEDPGYDDIALCGVTDRATGEKVAKLGGQNAVISFVGPAADEKWQFDVGSIHYRGWYYQGTMSRDIGEAYGRNVRSRTRPGGTCWLLGGAGAMGQMHTQLAVEHEDGPSRILVTDLDDDRIHKMRQQLDSSIRARDIEFKTLNPKSFSSNEAFLEAVHEFAPGGFDDIIMLVPVVPVLNQAVSALAPDGVMNIFAGIPAGKEAELDVQPIAHRGVRYIGSSGSRTYHLRHTLDMVESGDLNPATALAAIGGMKSLWKGLEGVAEARYPGKTVIFPHCPDMPLTATGELARNLPEADGTLSEDGLYTRETEKALFKAYSKHDWS